MKDHLLNPETQKQYLKMNTSERLVFAFRIAVAFVALLFLIEILERVFRIPLDTFGIVPREVMGLKGIVFSPLLHGGFGHLMANATSLLILMTLLFSNPRYYPGNTMIFIWVVSGIGVWLFGRKSYHIGASSIIYGMVTYLVAAGIWMRSWVSFLISLVILFTYSGLFWGVLPRNDHVSWEGHLCGAIAGVWAAAIWHKNNQ
jgi:membrane associated rhomboid family serine protease